ncbi:hypothetical protein QF049_005132 [Paenibacillus sp. W4I10]|uniref:hypothetical protein n=1 Tax=Paenibacillus sp. W4I10 TaxID=3042298 RepID=UPI002786C946|nr:hypothetical protein [Paenibacillus sp. W4I10]MDQ0723871.1 hypothetical protein [Paenibacillus sp. W4I10]
MNQRVTHRQTILLVLLLSISGTLIQPHAQAIYYAEQHAYLSYIPVVVVMLASMWMLSRVQRRFPDQDLFQALAGRFPLFGKARRIDVHFVFFLCVC